MPPLREERRMTKAELIQQIKKIAYNNKRKTKVDLIRELEQILRETGESVINHYELDTPEDEKRIEARDNMIGLEQRLKSDPFYIPKTIPAPLADLDNPIYTKAAAEWLNFEGKEEEEE